jgi:hypothetical protein
LLSGARISFMAVDPSSENHYVYSGRVDKNRITGTVQIRNGRKKTVENWTAILD